MKAIDTIYKKKRLIISLGIILGLSSTDLLAAADTDQSGQVELSKQIAQPRKAGAARTRKAKKSAVSRQVSQDSGAEPVAPPVQTVPDQPPGKDVQGKHPEQAKKSGKTEKHEELEEVKVTTGREKNLLGVASSASQGQVSWEQLEFRNISRPGELVELIPGMIATQHSGSGKANQYFLRGFNLDHGTDFTTVVDGIPMNMPTNAHGQGYMDLNSLIPELVNTIDYGKGPYYAEIGDFSAAGYSRMTTRKTLPRGIFRYTGGEFDYHRVLAANSSQFGDGNLLYAGEFQFYNGPWAVPENSHKYNGMLRYTLDREKWGMAVNAKGYSNTWTATNQIAQSAIESGQLGLYGSLSPSDQGTTNRYSLSANLWNKGDNWKNDANLYALYYDLNLYSNFTGYLNGPWGDQMNQTEHRIQLGGNSDYVHYDRLFGFDMDNSFGFNFRHDQINGLGLYNTVNRQYLDTISLADVQETTAGAYIKNETHWMEKFRTVAALRADIIDMNVQELANGYSQNSAAYAGAGATSTTAYSPALTVGQVSQADPALAAAINAANSGNVSKAMLSPKFSAIFGPWDKTEYYFNFGYGYHSNDARGTTYQFDPNFSSTMQLASQQTVTPMAWSRGSEIGARTNFIPGLTSTLTFWYLRSSQELVFSGDSGTTSVNGMSDRYGLELTNFYKLNDWVTLDFDYAQSQAYFVNTPPTVDGQCVSAYGPCTGKFVPNSIGTVAAAGIQVTAPNGIFGSLRLRHFGNSPLDSNGSVWAPDVNLVTLGLGYKQKNYRLDFNIFNLLGQDTSDVAYAYQYSSNPNDQVGSYGMVRHPVQPRMARAGFTIYF
ncbi:MAG: TonB-dependent receptor plug domain-containing protein [Methylococcales bacterium]|nr:TonB-dependent receptor plug domain-containing protein [Methylococcales bacterium]